MRATITIRKAQQKDIPRIRSILSREKSTGNTAPPFYFRWVIQEGIALVAEINLKTVGFLIAEKNNKIAYAQLIYLLVYPAWRNKKVGSSLLKHFIKICRKKGVKYIDLHASAQAAGFYRKFKFQTEGKFVALYRKWR